MADQLTPAEQAELNARMAHEQTIGPGNPNAQRVETPPEGSNLMFQQGMADDAKFRDRHQGNPTLPSPDEMTPAQRGVMNARMNGVVGANPEVVAGMAKTIGAIPRAIGRGASSLADFIGGNMAGISPSQVAAYKAAPQTVGALSEANALRRLQFENAATDSVSSRLTKKSNAIEGGLQDYIGGKTVPARAVPPESMGYFNGGAGVPVRGDLIQNDIPAKDLLAATRSAGKDAKFADNPMTPFGDRAKAKEAGAAWSGGRKALAQALPDFDPYMEAQKNVIDAQQGLSPKASGIEGQSTNPAAARQLADQEAGGTRLDRTANQVDAAKAMSRDATKWYQPITQPVGRGIVRATTAATPVASKFADTAALLGVRGKTNLVSANGNLDQPQQSDELTPAEAAELKQRLNAN